MRHGSLFSGIGGFDLAAEWMGWENVFHCEWNEFGQKVLKHYWPQAISYADITKSDFTIHRGNIDILTGGFPCQPYSVAGKRKGKEDERHLWPEMLRAIREIQPRWVVGENVRGLINWNGGMVFDEVQADLEALGYEVLPFLLPACAVNAPHRRDRIWFVAYSTMRAAGQNGNRNRLTRKGFATLQAENQRRKRETVFFNGLDVLQRDFTYTDSASKQGEYERCERERKLNRHDSGISRPGAWETFPTQPPVCDRNDGLSSRLDAITFPKWRTESIKAGGNAIVPQVAYQIFKAIEQYEQQQ